MKYDVTVTASMLDAGRAWLMARFAITRRLTDPEVVQGIAWHYPWGWHGFTERKESE